MITDHDRCYRIVQSRDPRFDGWFLTAVRTTGIYCRPSCPARTPKPSNVEFFPSAAAAQGAGYRACKRCRPDASPGSPEWKPRSDVVARAMALIADGVIDREGVGAVARRLGYSERQLNRLLGAELGAGPLALARSQRAQNARILVETTTLPMVDVAFAAGFASLRQFNDTLRQVYDATPTELRRRAASGQAPPSHRMRGGTGSAATITVRLAHRPPLDAAHLWAFLGRRAVAGCEAGDGDEYRRTLSLPRGHATVVLRPASDHVSATLRLEDVSDLTAAVARCRRLLDLDADPVAIDAHLAEDPALAPLIAARPGLRSPGGVDGFEIVVRAVLGQQVSVAAQIRAVTGLAAELGSPCTVDDPVLTTLFPTPAAVAALDPGSLRMPRTRARALVSVATEMAEGRLVLGPDADRLAARAALLAVPGIGPWTAEYVALRALGDPDVGLLGDLVIRRRAAALGIPEAELGDRSGRWSPWRSTVVHHLWAAAPPDPPAPPPPVRLPSEVRT